MRYKREEHEPMSCGWRKQGEAEKLKGQGGWSTESKGSMS